MVTFAIGICVFEWQLRVRATCTYLREGFAGFSHNWRETVLVSDVRHAPALLPGAGNVSEFYDVRGIQLLIRVRGEIYLPGISVAGRCAATGYFLFATLYRWNIKASALIWGPIALALSPTHWLDDEEMRTKTSFWSTWALQGPLWIFAIFVVPPWLVLPWLPKDIMDLLPTWARTLSAYLPTPPLGVRYAVLCCLYVSFLMLLHSAYAIRAAHDKALTGAGDYRAYGDELQIRLKRMAVPVRRWLKVTTAFCVMTVWVFSLWWALRTWPNELHNIVWDWLKP